MNHLRLCFKVVSIGLPDKIFKKFTPPNQASPRPEICRPAAWSPMGGGRPGLFFYTPINLARSESGRS